jgi:malonyl CoA-acyl carrier protein transacylase
VDQALEIGPGNVLSGLVRRIEKGIKAENYG